MKSTQPEKRKKRKNTKNHLGHSIQPSALNHEHSPFIHSTSPFIFLIDIEEKVMWTRNEGEEDEGQIEKDWTQEEN